MQYIMENNIFYNKQKFSHLFFDLENKQENVIGINKRKCEIENEIENLKKPKIIEELHYRTNEEEESENEGENEENGNEENENEGEDEENGNEENGNEENDDDYYYYDDPMDIDDPYDELYDEREDYECNLGYEDECYECLDIF